VRQQVSKKQKLYGVVTSAVGPLPPDWPILRAKFIFRERQDRSSTGDEELLSASHISGISKRSDKDVNMFLAESTEGYKIVCKGDAVVNTMWAWMGAMGISPLEGIISPSYGVYRPMAIALDSRYYDYLMRSLPFVAEVNRRSKGVWSSRLRLYPDEFLNLRLPFPEHQVQRRISVFLDRETARIDQLIEQKQRLLKLLTERRLALISHAIGRGCNENISFRSTGIEWMPELPEHWTVQPFRQLAWYQEGPGIMAEDFLDDGIPLLRIRNLVGETVELGGCNFLDPAKVQRRWNHFRVEVGDLLISASATTGGMAAEVSDNAAGAVPYTGIIRLRGRGYIKEFLRLFLLSSQFATQIDLLRAGSTMQHFGPSHLSRMRGPLPPRAEQAEIAARLADDVRRIERVTTVTQVAQSDAPEHGSSPNGATTLTFGDGWATERVAKCHPIG
jgi:type I restriction enzyme S subunit